MDILQIVLSFLKKNVILILAVTAAIFFFGRSCSIDSIYKEQSKLREERIKELHLQIVESFKEIRSLYDSVDILNVRNEQLRDSVNKKDEETKRLSEEFERNKARLSVLTKTQADSMLDMRYSMIESDYRSRAILIDLEELDMRRQRDIIQEGKIRNLESIIATKDQVIKTQEEIINEINSIAEAKDAIIEQKDGQLDDSRKAFRKMRRQRNGAVVGGGAIILIAILALI